MLYFHIPTVFIKSSFKFAQCPQKCINSCVYVIDAPENVAVISEVSVVEGSSLIMTCSSDSNPAPHTYHWFTDGETLLSEGHSFTLKNVSRHIGTIYCTAINTEGQTNSRPSQFSVLCM